MEKDPTVIFFSFVLNLKPKYCMYHFFFFCFITLLTAQCREANLH